MSQVSMLPSYPSFQFTHPGGVRHRGTYYIPCEERFNSRTREGCDKS